MNSRVMMMAMAVGFGLIAMFLSRKMLAREPARAEESQDILVAARDLKEEEILKPDGLKVIRMVKSAVPPGAFSTPEDVEDRWVKTAMLEGDVVIEKKLGPKGTPPGLVANIPPGMRAFAIDVTEQTGVSGFILPGHRVDVIRFDTDRGGQRGESILQDILVLASGQVFTRAEERSLTTRTVTLALTPEQVGILVAARAKGKLSLALRGVNDHEVVARPAPAEAPEPRSDADAEARARLEKELAELKAKLAARATLPPSTSPPPARRVHIYRGGREPDHIALDGNRPGAVDRPSPRLPEAIPELGIQPIGSPAADIEPSGSPGTAGGPIPGASDR